MRIISTFSGEPRLPVITFRWDPEWEDGQIRLAETGLDFSSAPERFAENLRREARRRKLVVAYRITPEGVEFQIRKGDTQ